MKGKNIGNVLIFISIVFCIGETIYFGFNFLPKNNAEYYCDLIVCFIFFMGYSIKKFSIK